jgi:hypothetical protein
LSSSRDSADRSARLRRVLLALISILAAWALFVAVTGGVDLRRYGVPFKSTDSDRPAYAALALMVVYAAAFRTHVRTQFEWLESRGHAAAMTIARRGAVAMLVPAAATFIVGMIYGVHIAGGSDSYGYISQADLWLAGDLVIEQPIASDVPWPQADWTFSPLGYRPGTEKGTIVPIYPAGLPLLMALGKWLLGSCGPFVIVPLLGALMVWLTYWLGTQVWSSAVGSVSAALMATSPTFVYMLLNPMTDVPVSACLLAAIVIALSPWRSRAFWTGLVVSMAIFIRPNLVPLGAVLLALIVMRAPVGTRWRALILFGIAGLPLILAVAALNAYLYGSPSEGGHGSLNNLYAWSNAIPNLVQYLAWLIRTETLVVILALVPLALLQRFADTKQRVVMFLTLFVAVVWLCYLFYYPFDVWWYLRFMLPAFPPMLVMAATGAALLLGRFVGTQAVLPVGLMLAIPLLALRISVIRDEGVLGLRRTGVVYATIAEYVHKELPPNAMILTVQHSGSIRHYGKRMTLRWDLLGREWWPQVFDVLVERGYRPYLVVSSFEEAQLRRQFSLSDAVDAPGTVVAAMDLPESVRVYDPLREAVGAPSLIPIIVPGSCGPITSGLDTARGAWQPVEGRHASIGVRQWCDGRSADRQ